MVSGFISFLVFFFALGLMIFVHELGHFIAARWAKIEVEEFGFGLPSYKLATLFKWQGTEFTIHALPLGGFIRPKGENDPNVPGGLAAASPWKRLVVLFAGPLMNLLTAVIVFSIIAYSQGMPIDGSVLIGFVAKNSPAEQAGLQQGDVLFAIGGTPVSDASFASDLIRENLDQPTELLIERNGEQITLTATPLSSRPISEGALGVQLEPLTRPATVLESIQVGYQFTTFQIQTMLELPMRMIQGAIAPEEARFIGFKGIYDLFNYTIEEDVTSRQEATQAQNTGLNASRPTNSTLGLIGLLSISLGVFNLFPIPALDGGRILFTLPEILFKKRIPQEWENTVNGVAMLLLIGLMLFVNIMDFVNPAQLVP